MYIIGDNNRLTRYALSTPWDISTAAFDNYFLNTAYRFGTYQSTYPQVMGIEFSDDGTSLYLPIYASGMFQMRLSTPYDISTATYRPGQLYTEEWYDPFNVPNARAATFKPDGTKV
jgi:hypothetical protein